MPRHRVAARSLTQRMVCKLSPRPASPWSVSSARPGDAGPLVPRQRRGAVDDGDISQQVQAISPARCRCRVGSRSPNRLGSWSVFLTFGHSLRFTSSGFAARRPGRIRMPLTSTQNPGGGGTRVRDDKDPGHRIAGDAVLMRNQLERIAKLVTRSARMAS